MTPFITRLGSSGKSAFGFGNVKKKQNPPSYAISPSTSSVNEGSSVTFTVTTTNVADGTTLYWTTNTISGTIDGSDFSGGATSGSVSITSGSASIVRTLANDATTEGSESFQLQLRTESVSGTIVATSSTVTIGDTSLTPTYSVSPSTSSVNEGSSVTFTVTTTNVADGTTLYWTINGSTNYLDFNDYATSGSFSISSGSGSITRTLLSDQATEGSESFYIEIRTGSTGGTIVATSSTVTVNDTSQRPVYMCRIASPYSSSMDTGESILIDASNNIYWIGYDGSSENYGAPANSYGPTIRKYSSGKASILLSRRVLYESAYPHSTLASNGNIWIGSGSGGGSSKIIQINNSISNYVTQHEISVNASYTQLRGIQADSNGDCFAVGGYRNSGYAYQVNMSFIAKFNGSTGAKIWHKQYRTSGLNDSTDQGCNAVDVDSSGNVYTAHKFWGVYNSSSQSVIAILKHNSSGTLQSRWTFAITGGSSDSSYELKLDSSGNIIIAFAYYYGGQYSVYLMKLNSSGTVLWKNSYTGGSISNIIPKSITIDSSGNIYVAGYGGSYPYSGFVLKTNSSGTLLWSIYMGQTNAEINGIAVGTDGYIYLSGYFPDGANNSTGILGVLDNSSNSGPTTGVTLNGFTINNASVYSSSASQLVSVSDTQPSLIDDATSVSYGGNTSSTALSSTSYLSDSC